MSDMVGNTEDRGFSRRNSNDYILLIDHVACNRPQVYISLRKHAHMIYINFFQVKNRKKEEKKKKKKKKKNYFGH